VACTPAAGWEKGQVENKVVALRDQVFRPKPRVKSLGDLRAWLAGQRIAFAKRTGHPEFKGRTIWEVFQDERVSLMEPRGPLDGFVEKPVRATTTCLIMADHNRYSVAARAAGQIVLVRSHTERIVVLCNGEIVAEHPRQFRRDQVVYDPWHYLPVLVKKPGALRNGALFKDWDLPPGLAAVREKLKKHPDGNREFVKVLAAGNASGDVIFAVPARQLQPPALLPPPLHRKPLPQHVHPELRWLPPAQDRLHDIQRQQRQHEASARLGCRPNGRVGWSSEECRDNSWAAPHPQCAIMPRRRARRRRSVERAPALLWEASKPDERHQGLHQVR
jgi:hypothetical protein